MVSSTHFLPHIEGTPCESSLNIFSADTMETYIAYTLGESFQDFEADFQPQTAELGRF